MEEAVDEQAELWDFVKSLFIRFESLGSHGSPSESFLFRLGGDLVSISVLLELPSPSLFSLIDSLELLTVCLISESSVSLLSDVDLDCVLLGDWLRPLSACSLVVLLGE